MNKKILLSAIAVVAAALVLLTAFGVMFGIWWATRPDPEEGAKTITVEVLHKDGTVNSYTINTDAETLAEAMNEKNLLGQDFDGMYYTVDGETTDYNADQSWWKLLKNGEDPGEGANTVFIGDGDCFRWEYTIGWG